VGPPESVWTVEYTQVSGRGAEGVGGSVEGSYLLVGPPECMETVEDTHLSTVSSIWVTGLT